MLRRDLLRCLGAAAALPFVPREAGAAIAFGRAAHRAACATPFRVLTLEQVELVTALADLILPRTDTPSASDVGVPAFIDHLLAEWYPAEEVQLTRQGLADVDRVAGGALVSLDLQGRETVAARLDAAGDAERGTAPWAWKRIKSLTVYGYFTSERVMTDVTKDPVIPGRFAGCVVVEP